MDEETPQQPDPPADEENKSSVLKDKALDLAQAGEMEEALAVAREIEDAAEKAVAMEAIAVAMTREKEAQPAVDVAAHERSANIGLGIGFALHALGLILGFARFASGDYTIGLVFFLVSLPFIIWGFMNLAAKKGYSMAVGLVGLMGFLGLPFLMILPDQRRKGAEARVGWHRWAGAVLLTLGVGLFIGGRIIPNIYLKLTNQSYIAEGEAIMGIGFFVIAIAVILLFLPKTLRTNPTKWVNRLTNGGLAGMGLGMVLITLGIWAAGRKWGPWREGIYGGTHRLDSASDTLVPNLVPLNWFEKLFAINFGPACITTGIILGILSLGLLGFGYYKAKAKG